MIEITITGAHEDDVEVTADEVLQKMLRQEHTVLRGKYRGDRSAVYWRRGTGRRTPAGNEIQETVHVDLPAPVSRSLFFLAQTEGSYPAPTIMITEYVDRDLA